MCVKIIVFLLGMSFSGILNANVLYNSQDQENIELGSISIDELQYKISQGDVKAKYLSALHKIYSKEGKEEGIMMLEKLADADIADAKYALYDINKRLNIRSFNSEKGLEYLKQSAEEGHSVAQLELARAYANGELGRKDPEQSFYWLKKSSEQNNPEAMGYIVVNYHMGIGVAKDDKKAFEWLMHAYNILGRNYNEWRLLGQAYERGIGTPINLTKAYMCYDLDGTAGIEDKARIAPRMTPEQRSEGLRLSQEWQEKNHVYTMQSLGLTRQKDGSYQ